jgi:hypothetical protein
MNPAHVHLLINHAPVLGAFVTLLLWIWALARRSDEVRRVALIGMVLVGLTAVPAYLSGEPAEDRVENAPGVTHEVVEEHEDAGKFMLAAGIVIGLVGLAGLAGWRQRPAPRWFGIAVLVVNLWVAAVGARTAWLGGMIRHTEIRPGATTTSAESGPGETASDDDD